MKIMENKKSWAECKEEVARKYPNLPLAKRLKIASKLYKHQ